MNNNYQKKNYNRNFAEFYNKFLTGQAKNYGEFIAEFLEKKVKDRSIADFMCGTGNLLKIFEENNWETMGVDISKEMLEIAARNLKNTELISADVTNFTSKKCYSVIVSTADAFNHLQTLEDIRNTFKSIYMSLKTGGYLIFDMNTPFGIKKNCFYISSSDDEGLVIREGFIDEQNGVGFTRFQGIFRKNVEEVYSRFDATIYNYIYEIDQIREVLINSGFSNIQIKDGYSDENWNYENTERVLFICQKEE